MNTELKQVWIKDENNEMVLIKEEVVEVSRPTQEEIIAEKEAELLKVYAELEALKNKS